MSRERLPLGDHALELEWFGARRGGTTLVLLHEGLGSVSTWRDWPDELARVTGMPVVAYSRLGYGGSDPAPLPRPLDYMEREARGDYPRLLDALGLDDVISIGHSDGASIALVHAAEEPGRVRKLVLLAPHVFCEDVSVAAIAKAKIAYETGELRARLLRHHGANVDVAFRGWNDAWLDPKFREWNLERYLSGIRAPVLVIQGEDDEYGTRAQVDAITGATGAASLLLPRCGHAPQRDAREATTQAIARFAG